MTREQPVFTGQGTDIFSTAFVKMVLWSITLVGYPVGVRYYLEWLIQNVRLQNGPLRFIGKTVDLYKFFAVYAVVWVADWCVQWIVTPPEGQESVFASVLLFIWSLVTFVANLVLGLLVTQWAVDHVRDQSDTTYSFTPPIVGYVGRYVVLVLTLFTVIGWAWYMPVFLNWQLSHVHASGRTFRFQGEGVEILWRTIAWVLACLPVVTLPWVVAASYRWYISHLEITYADAAVTQAEP